MKNKTNKKPVTLESMAITLESIDCKIDAKLSMLDQKIDNRIDELTFFTKKSFDQVAIDLKQLDIKIDGVELRLGNQISGMDNRLDNIAANKVSFSEHKKLETRVTHIEKKLAMK